MGLIEEKIRLLLITDNFHIEITGDDTIRLIKCIKK